MKNTIRLVLAAFAALFLASCAGTYNTPLGDVHVNDGSGGPPPQHYAGDGHGGPPGMRRQGERPELIDNGGYYSKSKWQTGVNRHGYTPGATISTFNQALSPSQKFDLANKIDAWAIERVKAKQSPPTDVEATAEARRIVGHELVRVKMGNQFSNKHIEQERKLISRERVDENEVPEPSRTGLKSLAEQQFYENQSNEIVKDGKIYPN